MPLTANALPSQVPTFALPFDIQAAFCSPQTLTATGYLNTINGVTGTGQIDLGGSGVAGIGVSSAGRLISAWALNVTAMDFANNDESYKDNLFGSNDVAFGNGNVELLAYHDFAAVSAGRQVPTILGGSPANPPFVQPVFFTTTMQKITYRYLRAYAVIAGTTPSVTLSSWVTSLGISL